MSKQQLSMISWPLELQWMSDGGYTERAMRGMLAFVPPTKKFRDISTILPRPGHSRDKAQTTGTVPAIPGRLATMRWRARTTTPRVF